MQMTKLKVYKPSNILFEKVATELAATWYEIGRSQGLKSKWKDARSYARANLEKFLPKAIEYCIDMLGRADINDDMKEMIYNELQERVNDPTNITSTQINGLPDIDIKKVLDSLPVAPAPISQALTPRSKPINISTKFKTGTAIGKVHNG
jgi:hypothetical protein